MIRAARELDLPAIATITNHYVSATTIHFAYEPVPVDEFRAMWLRRDRHPWLVADGESGVVGYAKAGVWRDRAAYAWTSEIGVYVAPDAHRQGVARALYTELLGELEGRGFRSVIAGITLPNDASIALHRAFGFVSVGTVRDAGYKFDERRESRGWGPRRLARRGGAQPRGIDRWHDVEFWQKPLGPRP